MENKYWSLVTRFFKSEPASGILLMFAAVLAMIFANTFLSTYYEAFLSTPLQISVGSAGIDKPLLLWINDG